MLPGFSVFLLAALAFLPCLRGGFLAWDDAAYVVHNPLIRDLSVSGLSKIFTTPYDKNYVPLSFLSLALEYRFFGLNPAAYHLDNVLLHALNSVLVFRFLFLVSGRRGASWAAAMLFAVHPVHVESVAWIAERKDVLYAFFFLAAAVCYARYRNEGAARHYFFSLLFFLLSCLSKPTAVMFPVLMILVDHFFYGRPGKPLLLQKVPFFVLSALCAYAAVASGNVHPDRVGSVFENALYANYAVLFYLSKIFAPFGLSCYYPMPQKAGGFLPAIFYAAPAILAAVFAAAWYFRERLKVALFALLFLVTALLPNLQLVPSRGFIIVADRYAYISSIGVLYAVGLLLAWGWERLPWKAAVRLLIVGLFAVLFAMTWQRCGVWRDTLTLWTDVVRRFPESAIARVNVGKEKSLRGDLSGAEADCLLAIRLDPQSTYAARQVLGTVYVMKGDLDEAVRRFRECVLVQPQASVAWTNLGSAYLKQKKYGPARDAILKAVRLDPKEPLARFALGNLRLSQGSVREAVRAYEAGLALASEDDEEALLNLAIGYARLGKAVESERVFRRLLAQWPDSTEGWNGLGVLYANTGRYVLAVQAWQETLRRDPGNVPAAQAMQELRAMAKGRDA